LRSAGDPAVADKLLEVVRALQRGADLDDAAEKAGLDRDTAARFMASIEDYLVRHLGRPTPAKKPARTPGMSLRLIAVSDGASRGNPGEAACAAILSDEHGEELLRRAQRLGVTTNNVAEYHGVILALELAQSLGAADVVLKIDSELVAKQLTGEYKIKHPSLKPLVARARQLADGLERFQIVRVGREETHEADRLANAELDGKNDA
jgi:ribonuclease HI